MHTRTPEITLTACPPFEVQMPHLGLGYLAANLERAGAAVQIYDLNLELYQRVDEALRQQWETAGSGGWWMDDSFLERFFSACGAQLDGCIDELLARGPRVLGFSVYLLNCITTMKIIERVRAADPEVVIVAGGPAFYTRRQGQRLGLYGYHTHGEPGRREQVQRWLEQLDVVVLDEGEATTVDVLARLAAGRAVDDVPGTARVRGGRHILAARRPLAQDLDSIAFPTYRGFELQRYTTRQLPLLTSRGCTRSCVFCVERTRWRATYRERSADDVAREIAHHVTQSGVTDFRGSDSLLNGSLARLNRLCALLQRSGHQVSWCGNMVVDPAMDAAFFRRCRGAGADHFIFGLETGSAAVLERMEKGFFLEEAEHNLHDCADAGIRARINMIVGYPGETEEDFQQSLAFLYRNRQVIDQINLLGECKVIHKTIMACDPAAHGVHAVDPGTIRDRRTLFEWRDEEGTELDTRQDRLAQLVDVLVELGIPRGEQRLPEAWDRREALSHDDRQWTWLEALADVEELGRYPLTAALELAFEHDNPRVRAGAARLAGMTREGWTAPHLAASLQDEDEEVKGIAARALGALGDQTFAEHLRPLLERYDALEAPLRRALRSLYERFKA